MHEQRWLVLMDTDRIKDYIFATNRLKEIRGASLLLDKLNCQDARSLLDLHQGTEVFIGGGGVLAIFQAKEKADAYLTALQSAYRQQTKDGASITGVVEAVANEDDEEAALRRARQRLRLAKAVRTPVQPLLVMPLTRICPSCNQYPVVILSEDNELCLVCMTKRHMDAITQQPGLTDIVLPTPFPAYAGYTKFAQRAQALYGDPHWLQLDRLRDKLDELEGTNTAHIGFLHADVNGLGAFLERQKRLDDIRDLGPKIEIALEAALVDAAMQVGLVPNAGERHWPFLILIMGGDDLTLVVPARKAVPLANALCLHFEEQIQRLLGTVATPQERTAGKLALSAGVVIAKPSYPIYALAALADNLTASAKRFSYELSTQYGPIPTVDFQVIHTPTSNPIEQIRAEEYVWERGGSEYHYTVRPYCCHPLPNAPALSALLATIVNLRRHDFPRNKLNQWIELIYEQDDLKQILDWKIFQMRVTGQPRKALQKALYDLQLSYHSLFLEPQSNAEPFVTPLLDLLELYQFVDSHAFQAVSSPSVSSQPVSS